MAGARLRPIDLSSYTALAGQQPGLIVAKGDAKARGIENLFRGLAAGAVGFADKKQELEEIRKRDERDNRDFMERQAEHEADEDWRKTTLLQGLADRKQAEFDELSNFKMTLAQLSGGQAPPEIEMRLQSLGAELQKAKSDAQVPMARLLRGYRSSDLGASGSSVGAENVGGIRNGSFPPIDVWKQMKQSRGECPT